MCGVLMRSVTGPIDPIPLTITTPPPSKTTRKQQAQYPDVIADVRGWGLINGVELSQSSGLQAAKVVQVGGYARPRLGL